MGEKFEVYLDQQYIGQADAIMPDITSKMEPETFPASEELSFEVELSGLTSNEALWRLIQRACETAEEVSRKLKEMADEMNLAFAAWNEMAELASETAEKKHRPRYKQGVSIRECRTDVTGGRWVVDRLAQENKPPG